MWLYKLLHTEAEGAKKESSLTCKLDSWNLMAQRATCKVKRHTKNPTQANKQTNKAPAQQNKQNPPHNQTKTMAVC